METATSGNAAAPAAAEAQAQNEAVEEVN